MNALIQRYLTATRCKENVEKIIMQMFREILQSIELRDEDWAILETCIREKVAPLSIRVTAEEVGNFYTEQQILTLTEFYEAHPWIFDNSTNLTAAVTARVKDEQGELMQAAFVEVEASRRAAGLED